jgi:hypothetical protein
MIPYLANQLFIRTDLLRISPQTVRKSRVVPTFPTNHHVARNGRQDRNDHSDPGRDVHQRSRRSTLVYIHIHFSDRNTPLDSYQYNRYRLH